MSKKLWELEISSDLKDRQLFVDLCKKEIERLKKRLEEELARIDPWHAVDKQLFKRSSRSEEAEVKELADSITHDLEAAPKDEPEYIQRERQYITMLKNKLANYDVYKQNLVCIRCREPKLHCVCDEINL